MNRAAPQQIAGVLPATRTTFIGTFQLAPQATLWGSVPRMGEALRPSVSTTTADGDWHMAMTLGASPYLLVRLVYPVEFLALAVDISSSRGYRPGAGGIIHTQSDLAAGIEIRLRATGSRVQRPEGQKIYLFYTTVRPPLDPPTLLFDGHWGSQK